MRADNELIVEGAEDMAELDSEVAIIQHRKNLTRIANGIDPAHTTPKTPQAQNFELTQDFSNHETQNGGKRGGSRGT